MRLTILLIIAGVSAGGYFYFFYDPFPGVAILRDADRTEVFRVGSRPITGPMVPNINGYPILKAGPEQGLEFTRRLTQVLRSKGITRNKTKCPLEPTFGYRVRSGTRTVEILIGFRCNLLWAHVGNEPVTEKASKEWKTFDAAPAKELFKLSREVFPDDRELKVE